MSIVITEEDKHMSLSISFMEAVEEFYDDWKKDNGATLPDFEEALEQVKEKGVLPVL